MLWGDARRGLFAAVVALYLAALGGWYAWLAMGIEIGWREYTSDPQAYDGHRLTFPLWTVTRVVDGGRYEISKVVKDIPVEGDASVLKVGDSVSVVARFDAARLVAVEERREIHTLRVWKERLGMAGVAAWALAMPFCFVWVNRRLVERGDG
jgi:hypothetical protein